MSIKAMIIIYVIEFILKFMLLMMSKAMSDSSYTSRRENILQVVFLFAPIIIVIIQAGAFLLKPWIG